MVLISANINRVSALSSSAGAVRVRHPYGTSEGDGSCTTTFYILYHTCNFDICHEIQIQIPKDENKSQFRDIFTLHECEQKATLEPHA